ncbi:MAG: PAS domain S-box protein [bacterium]
MLTGRSKDLFYIFLTALGYYCSSKAGLVFRLDTVTAASALWLPSGIALAVLLLYGMRLWPGVWLGAFAMCVTSGHPPMMTVVNACGVTAEATLAAWLILRTSPKDGFLSTPRNVILFVAITLLSCLISAFFGNFNAQTAGGDLFSFSWDRWTTWWMGDVMGILVFTPMLMVWIGSRRIQLTWQQTAERAVYFILLILGTLVIFHPLLPIGLIQESPYLLLIFVVCPALRFSQRETTLSIAVIAIVATWATFHGHGPFSHTVTSLPVIKIQMFLGIFTLTGLLMSAAKLDRKKSMTELKPLSGTLDQLVLERDYVGVMKDITERVQTGLALTQSEDLFRTLFDESPDSIFIIDPESEITLGRIVDCNEAAARMNGYTRKELIGQSINILNVEPTTGKEWLDYIRYLREAGPLRFEFTHRRRDGAVMPIEIMTTLIKIGHKDYVLGIDRDITERRRFEQALQQSEGRFRVLFDVIPDGILVIDPHTGDGVFRIADCNNAAAEMHGYTREELIGQTLDVFNLAAASPEERKEFIDVLHRDHWKHYETRHKKRDGTVFPIDVITCLITLDGQEMILGIDRDITERKQKEDALRESERRLADVINFLPDATFAIDLNKNVIIWNKAIEAMTGIPADQIIGKGGHAYTVPFYGTARPNMMDLIWEDDKEIEAKYPSLRRQGDILFTEVFCPALYHHRGAHVMAKASPLRDADGRITGAIESIRDITVEIERESHLRQAQKMEAIGMLAGGIAHDFNNILASIIGFTEIAKQRIEQHNRAHDALDQALIASKRATELVKQILTFSHRTGQERRPFNMHLIVSETMQLIMASLPASIRLLMNIRQDDDTIVADPIQIQQIVMNLCVNAIHAMSEAGGEMTVTLGTREADPKTAERYSVQPGAYVAFAVKDTGQGIAPELIDRIFLPFFTTKEVGVGTGMGLAVVHGIVTSHGGFVQVESSLGKGSQITVNLPREPRTEGAPN